MTKGWKEEVPDEWDQSLDKGHVRKVKKKRPAPVENPFDKVPVKRTPHDFEKKDKKRFNKKFPHKKNKPK